MNVDENSIIDEAVEEYVASHVASGRAMSVGQQNLLPSVRNVIAALRANGTSILAVLKFLEPIILMVLQGMPLDSIVKAILALLGVTLPASPVASAEGESHKQKTGHEPSKKH